MSACSTYAPHARLDIELPPDTETEVKCPLSIIKTSWGIQIDVGDIQFCQSREFIVPIADSYANVSAALTYRPFDAAEDPKTQAIHTATPNAVPIKYHAARLDFLSFLFAIPQTNNLLQSTKALTALKDRLTSSMHNNAQALAKDIGRRPTTIKRCMVDTQEGFGRLYLARSTRQALPLPSWRP